jgi:hypothetical protein
MARKLRKTGRDIWFSFQRPAGRLRWIIKGTFGCRANQRHRLTLRSRLVFYFPNRPDSVNGITIESYVQKQFRRLAASFRERSHKLADKRRA